MPFALPLGKRHANNCTGGWMSPGAHLDESRKSHPTLVPTPYSICTKLLYQLRSPNPSIIASAEKFKVM
jgi:hypothetical protein